MCQRIRLLAFLRRQCGKNGVGAGRNPGGARPRLDVAVRGSEYTVHGISENRERLPLDSFA